MKKQSEIEYMGPLIEPESDGTFAVRSRTKIATHEWKRCDSVEEAEAVVNRLRDPFGRQARILDIIAGTERQYVTAYELAPKLSVSTDEAYAILCELQEAGFLKGLLDD
jgi:hypothetical protein